MKRVNAGDRVMTKCEGGFCLKPAPVDGWLLDGDRFVSDVEVDKLHQAALRMKRDRKAAR